MGNPYAPTRLPISDDEAAGRDLVTLVGRLRVLGLDEEGIADLIQHWDDFDDDWTPDTRRALVRAPDRELQRLIRSRDSEFAESTLTAEEQALEDLTQAVMRAEVVGEDKIGGTVAEVLEWVSEDRVRAMAASNLERSPAGGQRKTLLAELDRIINGS